MVVESHTQDQPLAYYNEHDPYAAQWLRNLIAAGLIPFGIVDERSIEDVLPEDLRPFTQCHFFAGVGVWPLALRRAGWVDSRPVWTGSCPCQPYSAAGKGEGFADERHLWPAFHHLILADREWRRANDLPLPVVAGEQVASSAADAWIDLVQDDMEALGDAFGAIAFPAAGVGAPHIRDRTYWLADPDAEQWDSAGWLGNADHARLEGFAGHVRAEGRQGSLGSAAPAGVSGGLANLHGNGREPGLQGCAPLGHGQAAQPDRGHGRLADAGGERRQQNAGSPSGDEAANGGSGRDGQQSDRDHEPAGHVEVSGLDEPGPSNGYWAAADWLLCRDGKWRPVEPGTFPLAHGAASRVGRLRAYGNALNALAAENFIRAYEEARAARGGQLRGPVLTACDDLFA